MSPRIATFEWDAANLGHIAEHLVSRDEVQETILDPFCFTMRDEVRDGELRYKAVGETASGRLMCVIFTIRLRKIRPVTAYPAPRKISALYRKRRNDGE